MPRRLPRGLPRGFATRAGLVVLAERWWRPLLAMAALVFVLSGPAHAFGRTDAVFYAALVGVTLGAAAVPLGLLGLYAKPDSGEPS